MTVRAYIRVSTADQATNGHGPAAQRSAIEAEADRRGWTGLRWYEDGGYSGKDLDRPAMRDLLGSVRQGDTLIVAKLDRLSRSLVDFASLMERAQRERWNVVALDLGVDLSSPHGEFLASVMAAIARWERRVIGQRTAEGMAAAKAKGVLPDGVRGWTQRPEIDWSRRGRQARASGASPTVEQRRRDHGVRDDLAGPRRCTRHSAQRLWRRRRGAARRSLGP